MQFVTDAAGSARRVKATLCSLFPFKLLENHSNDLLRYVTERMALLPDTAPPAGLVWNYTTLVACPAPSRKKVQFLTRLLALLLVAAKCCSKGVVLQLEGAGQAILHSPAPGHLGALCQRQRNKLSTCCLAVSIV